MEEVAGEGLIGVMIIDAAVGRAAVGGVLCHGVRYAVRSSFLYALTSYA